MFGGIAENFFLLLIWQRCFGMEVFPQIVYFSRYKIRVSSWVNQFTKVNTLYSDRIKDKDKDCIHIALFLRRAQSVLQSIIARQTKSFQSLLNFLGSIQVGSLLGARHLQSDSSLTVRWENGGKIPFPRVYEMRTRRESNPWKNTRRCISRPTLYRLS